METRLNQSVNLRKRQENVTTPKEIDFPGKFRKILLEFSKKNVLKITKLIEKTLVPCFLKKGPVKLIEWAKIALLFLHPTTKLFQFTILNLPGFLTSVCQGIFQNELLTRAI